MQWCDYSSFQDGEICIGQEENTVLLPAICHYNSYEEDRINVGNHAEELRCLVHGVSNMPRRPDPAHRAP